MFNHRALFMLVMTLATLVLGYMGATRLALAPSFEKMIPRASPTSKTSWRTGTPCVASATRCEWWWRIPGDIFDPDYLSVLKRVNDELFLTEGVDRAWMKSLWSPAVRWTEVTEEGASGRARDAGCLSGIGL